MESTLCSQYGRQLAYIFEPQVQYGVAVDGVVEVKVMKKVKLAYYQGCTVMSFDRSIDFDVIYCATACSHP